MPVLRLLAFLSFAMLTFIGCESAGDVDTGPPEGWESAGERWWVVGADTTSAFRDMETLQAMGIEESDVYAASQAIGQRSGLARQRLAEAVKRSLLPLYRNEPELVDSLFDQFVAPKLAEADLSGDPRAMVDQYQRQGYKLIHNHFKEPQTAKRLGEDIPVPYPDSLRTNGVGGSVNVQVRLDEEGTPVAIALVESVHPVLDAIAMNATTQMRWRPAYRFGNGRWKPISSWARYQITFRASEPS